MSTGLLLLPLKTFNKVKKNKDCNTCLPFFKSHNIVLSYFKTHTASMFSLIIKKNSISIFHLIVYLHHFLLLSSHHQVLVYEAESYEHLTLPLCLRRKSMLFCRMVDLSIFRVLPGSMLPSSLMSTLNWSLRFFSDLFLETLYCGGVGRERLVIIKNLHLET